MEDKDLLKENPITTSVETTTDPGYAAFEKWANTRTGNYGLTETPELKPFQASSGQDSSGRQSVSHNRLAQLADESNSKVEDTSKFSYNTKDISKRYPLNYLGINNEELYAANQSTMQKAYNGVVKMAGTAGTTFINGTAGTVYGILEAAQTKKLSSFYNNDLTNYLNNINTEMEDTYAHYKTERETKGDWWEPANLFTANFLFDNVIKNLGFSLGAVGAGFAWGAALKAIGLTGRLMATGEKWAAAADTAIGEATTLAETERLVAATSKLEGLWGQAKSQVGKGLMNTDRSIVATFGTFGESGMEALNNSQQFRNQMISEFKQKHGYDPDGKDLDAINEYAESVGDWSFGLNTALLTATNYIQLPKIYSSSFKSEKQILNGVARQGEKYVETLPEKGFGKLLYKAKNIASLGFNTSEAFEEGGQYAIQIGTQHYFNRKYNNQDASVLSDGLLHGVKEALTSSEGTLNIFTGGFSGALQSSGVVGVKGFMPTFGQTGKIGERGWTGYGGEQAVLRNEAVTALNNTMIKTKLKEAHSNILAAESIQTDRTAAIRRGDILESKDLEFDYAHSFVATRLKYNAKDAVDSEIESLKQEAITDAGFQKLQQEEVAPATDTKESFINRLNNLQEHANHAAKLQETLDIKYKGLLNDKGEPLYPQTVLDELVYAGSKIMDYNKRIPQVNSSLINSGIINTQEIIDDILKTGNLNSDLYNEAVSKIDSLSGITSDESDALKRDLEDLAELSLRKKLFIDEYNDIKNNPKDYSRDQILTDKKGNKLDSEGNIIPVDTISIKTKRGVRDIEVGTEYFLGKVIGRSSKGNEVYRAPRLIVLGRNEDGTIKVQDSDGKVHDVKESTLEKYNLGKVDSTLKNKKAKFYMEHWNTVYEFNFGAKTGGKQKGRIEYDPETNQMLFVYNNKKGERKEIEVTGDQFVANKKKGYKEPMIKSIGELTAVQQKALSEFVAEKDPRIDAKREARLAVLNDLFDNLADRQIKINKTIDQKQKELVKNQEEYDRLQKEIESAQLDKRTKAVRFKAATTKALESAMRLSRMQAQIEKEIEDLKTDSEEIEFTLNYITDMAANIDEYSTNFKDFMTELQDEILDLEVLQEATQKQITTLSKLARETQKALDLTIDFLSKLISSFESRYPSVPRLMGQDWVDFLKNNPNFLKLKPNYRDDLRMIDDIVSSMEDKDVIPNESRLKDLTDHLSILQGSLDEVQQEIDSKEIILNKFKAIADAYKQQKAEDDRLRNDQTLRAEYLGTNSETVQSFFGKENYEASAKKDDLDVVGSTIAVTRGKEGEVIREHHARANRFGFNLHKFDNKSDIRGVVVTATTEKQLGLEGLMEHLTDGGRAIGSDGKPINPKSVIALVMVQDNGDNTHTLVDENGVPFTAAQLANPINNAVYQVFPTSELEAFYKDDSGKSVKGTMFRKQTKDGKLTDAQESLKQQYDQWRTNQLKQTVLPAPQSISASFGIPDYVKRLDEKNNEVRDYDARVPVEQTGLLEDGALIQDPLLMIATTNDSVSYGKVTFETPKGRVFLKVPNGLVKLKNRQFTEKEANTIFDVIHQVTKNASKDGTTKTAETQYLLSWLKTVVYWGIAKNLQTGERKEAGYNNIWFETVTEGNKSSTKLFMSGLQTEGFDFTPTGLENKKSEIIAILKGMYNNVNAPKVTVDSFKKKYNEIIGIDEEGKPILKSWDNYQTYLLSSEGRTNDEIPLVTQIRPLTDPTIPNKKGIYFTLDSTQDDFNIPTAPVVVTAAPVVAPTIADNKTPAASITPVVKTYDLKGETFNDYKLGAHGIIPFKIDAQKFIDTKGEEGLTFKFEAATMESLMAAKGISEQEAQDVVYAVILNKIRPQIDAFQTQSKVPATDNPQTTFDLSGEGENIIQIDGYGKVIFTLDGKKFNATHEGFNIQFGSFDGQVIQSVMEATGITQKEAYQKVGDTIYEKVRPQLEAMKIPVAPAIATPVVPSSDEKTLEELFMYGVLEENRQEAIDDILKAANVIIETGQASSSLLQRRFKLGYNKAARHVEVLEKLGIVGEFTGTKAREVLITDKAQAESLIRSALKSSTPEVAPTPTTPKATGKSMFASRQKGQTPDDSSMRVALANQARKFQGEDWAKLEEGIKKMLPNVPLYRVKNIIQATNGKQAWGMLHDGAIYVYENAEVGTVYHEVFEAIWKMFADAKEKEAVLKEFASRPGTFVDRETGNTVAYKNATAHQMKEELAEEFRDAVLKDKLGEPIASKSLIGRLFSELIKFIKSFFISKDAQRNTKELFDKIGNGYYATYNPYVSQLAYAKSGVIDIENATADVSSDLRVKNIPATQLHEIIEEMTFITLKDLIDKKESFFDIIKPTNQKDLYNMLQSRILSIIGHQADLVEENVADGTTSVEDATRQYNDLETLYNNVFDQWDDIIKKHKEKLKTFNVEFDENDELILGDEDASGKSDWQDARKIDSFRKANGAVKLLLGTLPVSYVSMEDGVRKLRNKPSSIGGAKLMPADEIYIKLKNKLFDSVDMNDMMNRLKVMAFGDPTYENLYKRLTKVTPMDDVDYKTLDQNGIQLLSAFWKSMKSQNADAISVFVLSGGEVIVSDSTLTSSAKQSKYDMTNTMIDKIKSNSMFFSYEAKTGRYYATDKIKSMVLNGSKLESYTSLLKELGIEFDVKTLKKLNDNQLENFRDAVEGIQNEFTRLNEKSKAKTDSELANDEANGEVARGIKVLTPKTLNIEGRLFQLGLTRAIIENKGFESTYFNMNGERTQTYIGGNTLSAMHNVLSKLNNIDELSSNPAYNHYEYLRTDAFAKGSVMLQKMFNLHPTKGTGKRIFGTQDLMKSVYIDGTDNQSNGKKKESSKLSAKERLVQEINLNLNGYYLNLVPGDASIEWAVKMVQFLDDDNLIDNDHHEIFKNYFMSEVELAREGRNVVSGKKSSDLRFFKAILGEELNNQITKTSNSIYTARELYEGKPEEGFKGYKAEIDAAVDAFINKDALDTEDLLRSYNVITYGEEGLTVEDISFGDNIKLTEESLTDKLRLLSVNYIIANIEMHKLLYSDPYQYKDELKRIKNFNSPRQALMTGSQDVNSALDAIYNKGYKPGDAGYTDMTIEYFRSITLGDVLSVSELEGYSPYEETDGGGYITLKANRIFGIRSGEWTTANEAQYRHDMEFEELVKSGASVKELEKFDRNSPNIASTYTPRKPIVSGNKQNGRDYNDVVMHKFALFPLSFRLLYKINPESNAIKLYNKMQSENIDYAVYASGSKVGTEKISPLYDKDGNFDNTPFEDEKEMINVYQKQAVSNIPFTIMGVQAEVPSKEAAYVTQGSQITKLATLDFMEAGVPIDFDIDNAGDFNTRFIKWVKLSDEEKLKQSDLYKDIKHNQDMLEAKIEYGYKSLLKKLGLRKTSKGFEISNVKKLIDTLRDEILKREVNDNITDAFDGFENGHVVLEATPAYQQIRNILYSIADKNVVSPKISGGMKVQVPGTLLESKRPESKVVKGKDVYSSDLLRFYTRNENGKSINVCQIMVGKWFKSSMSDDELINYFNKTEEGKKEFAAITGVAFRIPTQKQNSIDVFEIAKFLPDGYKDSVVIPSELVMKAGSDFDIDKLSIYLKNVYTSNDKTPKQVPYLGTGQEAIDKFGELYDNGEFNEYLLHLKDALPQGGAEDRLMESMFPEEYSLQREDVINTLYKQSLENEYISSLQKLISNDLNFDNLIKPNSADELKRLSKTINDKLGNPEIDYGAVGNMMKRSFMTSLRHAFVTGKYAIGIAAVNQTNHAQNQRSVIYIDTDKKIDPEDQQWLGDGLIKFQEYNSVIVNGVKRATLSKIKSADDKTFISDTIGQFIDGYVDISKGPWIMEMGASPNVASTWMLLVKLGVPIKTVGYFMNQPSVRNYLKTIQNNGYSWLFIDSFVDGVKYDYIGGEDVETTVIPSESELYNMIGKNPEDMNPTELSQQTFILDEFLKYAMMANHLFQVTQGSNYDTATINDPYLVFKKEEQLKKARNTIYSSINEKSEVIPAVDAILKSSFVGPLKDVITNVRNAFAEVLISDRTTIRSVMEDVLRPYIGLPDRDFIKISQKAVNDLFDWAVQTDMKINNSVKKILLGTSTEKSAAKQIIEFRDEVLKDKNHPLYNNLILNSIQLNTGNKIVLDEYPLRDGNTYPTEVINMELLTKLGYTTNESKKLVNMLIPKVDNLSIVGRDTKVYDQNLVIYAFNELKEKLGDENKDLYGKLVRLAVIQSGLTNSPIAFTNLLPYDDFKEVYNKTLSNLENKPNLADFNTLNIMERNNWNNTNVTPYKKGRLRQSKSNPSNWYYPEKQFLSRKLQKKTSNGTLPEMITFSMGSREGRNDFIVYSYEGKITKTQRIKARRTGDTSHVNKGLYKKVYTTDKDGNPTPLIQESEYEGKFYFNYVYKAINAWGDSYKAQEFYGKTFPMDPLSTVSKASVLDNGFVKVQKTQDSTGQVLTSDEVEDSAIELALLGTTPIIATIKPVEESVTSKEIQLKERSTVERTLKDGNSYNIDDIKLGMLNKMGYTPLEIGEILKQIREENC